MARCSNAWTHTLYAKQRPWRSAASAIHKGWLSFAACWTRPCATRGVAGLAGLSQTCEDETDRKLLTRDVDGEAPFLDPRLPVRPRQLHLAVRKLGLSEEEVRRRYDRLAERFALTLAWNDD